MHAPDGHRIGSAERLNGLRVVSTPAALDAARWRPHGIVIRMAADEAFAIGSVDVELADRFAIVEVESAFVGWWLSLDQFAERIEHRLEWVLPTARPALAQGLVAGVPVKLWLEHDRVLVIASSGLAHEVAERLFGGVA